MENTSLAKLQRKYQLETSLLRLERRSKELAAELATARYDQRSCHAASVEYQGSFRSFLDKLSGKQADRSEQLQSNLRKAEVKLNALLREQTSLRQEEAAVKEALTPLPSFEQFRQYPDIAPELYRLEARFCAEALIPMLEENYQALLELRRLRGERLGELISVEERQEIAAAPDSIAEQCRLLLERLKGALDGLGIPFELSSYYRAPIPFIATAADHNRRDRINAAMDQALAAKKHIAAIWDKLDE